MNTDPATLRLLDLISMYFQGEKIEALVFILPIGLLCLVFGGWLLAEGTPGFARGVAIPMLALGLLMTAVGAVVGFRTPAQVASLEAGLVQAPEATVQAERARMQKVNAAWKYYLVLWAIAGIAGLALRFLVGSDVGQGVGVALVFVAAIGLLVDGFAERRAASYARELTAHPAAR